MKKRLNKKTAPMIRGLRHKLRKFTKCAHCESKIVQDSDRRVVDMVCFCSNCFKNRFDEVKTTLSRARSIRAHVVLGISCISIGFDLIPETYGFGLIAIGIVVFLGYRALAVRFQGT